MNGFFIRQQFSNDKQTQADISKIKMLQILILSYIFKGKLKTISNFQKSTMIITNGVLMPTAILLKRSLHQCHLYLINYMFSDPSVKIGMLIIMVTFHDSTVKC